MSDPTVKLKTGRIEGIQQGEVAVFKGIPYAQPPVGELRWRPPQPVLPWTGTLKANKFGHSAWQRGAEMVEFVYNLIKGQGMGWFKRNLILGIVKYGPKPVQSEDCLTLTVRTPSLKPAEKLPVMVFIHGGAHQDGGSHDQLYDSNALAKKDVILVTINYRLGLMGFLAHPDLSDESPDGVSGNYGMLDQILALEWVNENIGHFGGDADNVTIFGESAGGESVLHLMSSPRAHGLFHKAIAQSPATGAQLQHLKQPFFVHTSAEEQGVQFANRAGAKSIKELRSMSAEALAKIVRSGHGAEGNFYPVIDGHYLPKSTFETFQNQEQAQVPFLIGSNEHENTLFSPMMDAVLMEYADHPHEAGKLPAYMDEEYGEDLPDLFKLYPGLEKRDPIAVAHFQGDSFFGTAARFYAGEMITAEEPVFLYHFRRKSPLPKQTAGAFHAAELPFVFGLLHSPIFPSIDEDAPLAETMQLFWTNFAKTGNPNGESVPNWSEFTDVAPYWMVFDRDEVGVRPIEIEANYQIFMRRLQKYIDQLHQQSKGDPIAAD